MNAASSCLTRHFVRHFLDIGFTSPEGADGVRRAALGVLSAVLAIGLLLARMMMTRYSAIAATATVYRASVLGDTLMTFGFAMLAAAFAAALAGESMFPDETDFRVLTPLPVTRGFVFAAKLRAVAEGHDQTGVVGPRRPHDVGAHFKIDDAVDRPQPRQPAAMIIAV